MGRSGKKKEMEKPYQWDRQPEESVQQYERFCAYRDMKYQADDPGRILSAGEKLALGHRTGQRSLRRLADQMGCSRQSLEVLSTRFHWKSRAEAYDLDVEARIRAENEAVLFKMRKVHADLARSMLTKAARGLLLIQEDSLDAASVARLVDVGVKVERLSRGETTQNTAVSGVVEHTGGLKLEGAAGGLDLSKLTDGELEALDGLLKKLHPEPPA